MKKNFECVLVTGASGSIGRALAVEAAKRGAKKLFLLGRDVPRLEETEKTCLECGCAVQSASIDVRDREAMEKWIRGAVESHGIDLVIANAGRATGKESTINMRETFEVNLTGVLNTVFPAIDAFLECGQSQRRRQIAIISSMTAHLPLPQCPSYAASKAAVKSLGLSLRGFYMKKGIAFNVVCPGFVRSAITDRNSCPMPFFMEPERAAKTILDGLEKNIGLITFPLPLRFLSWLVSAMPWPVAGKILSTLPGKNGDNDE